MKKSAASLTAILVAFAPQSFAEILRCKGAVEWGGVNTQIRMDITMPKKLDAVASVSSGQQQTSLMPVGRGRIDLDESPGQLRTSDLYVTSLDTGIVTGFFVEGVLIYVLRLSPRAKSFSYFDSFRERLITGNCE